ncbi:hypothetical protein [Phaeospirillum tilakii]|uniref:Uncharacterized protein n=1 Tax=Phaeospirillum tilakii TaxID=741673 RepID=A0ABW5CAJ1_9PROT
MSLDLCLHGPGAAALEPLALDLLRRLGGAEPVRRVDVPAAEGERGRVLNTATVVLTLVGGVNDLLSLEDRFHLTEAVTRFLAEVHASGTPATLRYRLDPPLDLSRATADEVMDRLSR